MVGPQGLEPWTKGLRVPCSNQLSYSPIFFAARTVSFLHPEIKHKE